MRNVNSEAIENIGMGSTATILVGLSDVGMGLCGVGRSQVLQSPLLKMLIQLGNLTRWGGGCRVVMIKMLMRLW